MDGAGKALERTVSDAHYIAHVVVNLVLRLFAAHALHDLFDLFVGYRRWLGAAAHEPGNGRRVAHDVPRVFTHLHLYQHIALETTLFNDFTLAVLDFNHFLFWYNCFKNFVLHSHSFRTYPNAFG